MKLAAVIVACGLAAGVAQAGTIDVSLTGTFGLISGTDTAGLHGDSFVMTASFDSNGIWQDLFGLPSADAVAQGLSIAGSGMNFNESLAYFPTFAGTFSTPGGTNLTFNSGGTVIQLFGFMFAAPGANDAVIGGAIEFDDFDGALYAGTGGITGFIDMNGDAQYTLKDAKFDVVVPTPAGMALLGLGGLVATRRRR